MGSHKFWQVLVCTSARVSTPLRTRNWGNMLTVKQIYHFTFLFQKEKRTEDLLKRVRFICMHLLISLSESTFLTPFLKSESEVRLSVISTDIFLSKFCRPVQQKDLIFRLLSKALHRLQVKPAKLLRENHRCNHCLSNLVFRLWNWRQNFLFRIIYYHLKSSQWKIRKGIRMLVNT